MVDEPHLKCRRCGSGTQVINSRVRISEPDRVYRRRRCLKCGERFTTYEVREEVLKLVEAADALQAAAYKLLAIRGPAS